MKELLDILFLGDIVGRPGRYAVEKYLKNISFYPDFIIANVENASHGFGLTEKNYNDLLGYGIDAFTSGNHIWDKKEIFEYIYGADRLVRPLNYPEDTPGSGAGIIKKNDFSVGIINLLGRVFMAPMESPWSALELEVKRFHYETPVIIVDFHAEATAEKVTFGYFADKLGVSAVIGTHTHVQTADERILENGTGYITDVGYCGVVNSIIGMDIESSYRRLKTGLPARFDVAPIALSAINGVRMLINTRTGCTERIERINEYIELSEE